ncbi:MAG: deiodinase-like protein [Candidatus Korobacteraceae bacterium]
MFGSKYNYEAFQRNRLLRDLAASQLGGAPRPGDRAPDFAGRTLQGDTVRLKDFRGRKNIVLTFGSATCPQTAGSLPGLNDLYADRDPNVEFFFVYTREAHPGDKLGAHRSHEDKARAAELLRDAEGVDIPIIVDEVNGSIHRKYGKLPNPTFIIDKSGRIAFRSLATRASVINAALDELLEVQQEEGKDHAIVCDGEDLSLPSPQLLLRAHRALERGGRRSIANFRREMGLPGRVVLISSRLAGPIVENPGKIAAGAVAALLVLGLGVWGGFALRRKRLSTYRSPYESRKFQHGLTDADGYEAVGI